MSEQHLLERPEPMAPDVSAPAFAPPLGIIHDGPGAPPVTSADPASAKRIQDESLTMLLNVMGNARRTQARIAMSFTSYLVMLLLMFLVGIGAFVVATIRAAHIDSGQDVVVTAVFGGLSATAFVTTFLSRPITLMSSAGPEAAWLQAIVSTYWAKFAYQSDLSTIADDLDKAQDRLNGDMLQYFTRVAALDGGGATTPAGPNGPPPGPAR